MAWGWMPLVAVLDRSSRRVLARPVSIMMEAGTFFEVRPEAAARLGAPEIANTAHGDQFSGAEFVAEFARTGVGQRMGNRGAEEVQTAANPLLSGRRVFQRAWPTRMCDFGGGRDDEQLVDAGGVNSHKCSLSVIRFLRFI